ncbi:MAG: rane protein [Novosphingobium lindaniclasticum]|uniref:UbiA family prenyltransferase n=1 Tax=Novosphingobium lindaniclasticum TaxID=1329895 RepID=UPI00240A5912|nr:UbiA family prenyltransferase [Novosphingobium lindaniclasticum]MDF2639081.1 rane protein [Novosphingobium lindaniclasticum]
MPTSDMTSSQTTQAAARAGRTARLRDYLSLARFDHATKHVFVIPGLILAYALREPSLLDAPPRIAAGFVVAIAIASANYIINEWLDRESDAHHPSKHHRTAVSLHLSPGIVYLQYTAFAAFGLALASWLGTAFLVISAVFLVSGLIYNVQPLRSKDRSFLDVISESVNNPIRLTLGWLMMDPSSMPPASLLLAYWAGGAFLMGSKRLSEYRDITAMVGIETLTRYRKSFAGYTAESLAVSCLVYAMLSSFFLGVFLIKYRVEYILAFPFIAGLFGCYLWLSMLRDSIAQRPERMFRSRRLMTTLAITLGVLLALSFIDLPSLTALSNRSFTPVDMLPERDR